MLTETFDLPSKNKGTANFVAYYQAYFTSYTKKDQRVLSASLSKFKAYLQEAYGTERLAFKDVTPKLVLGFKDYLESKLTGEGPPTYYSRFKKVVKHVASGRTCFLSTRCLRT
ncbi:phage integrase SAM-like domain-containing protein [Pontibacter toksunensis]|uniref:Phage integrase SAM-like domain-containing protein n=1 Tax=Pontibacter toksunensis TaxID=1332631 RepID=A0ABW6BYK7_9BACT